MLKVLQDQVREIIELAKECDFKIYHAVLIALLLTAGYMTIWPFIGWLAKVLAPWLN